MSVITKLEIWKDTGFTEGAVEVPKISSLTLSNPDYTIESGLFPSKDRLFSSFKLEGDWMSLYDCSYVRVTIEFNNPHVYPGYEATNVITLYGWIDTVTLVSDTDERPMTQVFWHVDYWRTFASQAHYGYGMVTRRPRGTDDPIQSVPYRYRLAGERQFLEPEDGIYWAGIVYAHKDNDKIAYTRTLWCPFDKTSLDGQVQFKLNDEADLRTAPTLSDLVKGRLDEVLGIDPTSISYAFITPFAPFEYEWKTESGTANSYIEFKSAPEQTTELGPVSQEIAYTGKYCTQLITGTAPNIQHPNMVGYQFFNSDGTDDPFVMYEGSDPYGLYDYLQTYNGVYLPNGYLKYGNDTNDGMHFRIKLKDVYIHTLGQDSWNKLTDDSKIIVSRFSSGNVTIWNSSSRQISSTTPWPSTIVVTDTFTGQITDRSSFTKAECEAGIYLSTTNKDFLSFKTQTPITVSRYEVAEYVKDGTGAVFSNSGNYANHIMTFNPVKTTDTSECIVTDLSANPVGALPWGREFSSCDARTVCDSMSAYAEIRFEGVDGKLNGTTFSIPLPRVDITTNAWSSYNYSGQREYDVRQRQIARDNALTNGIVDTLKGNASNAILGYIGADPIESLKDYNERANSAWQEPLRPGERRMGYAEYIDNWKSENPRLPSNRGVVSAGAFALGVAGGVAGSALEWGLQKGYDEQLQSSTDLLTAKQTESIASFGNGWDWLWYGEKISLLTLVPDNYSLNRYAMDTALNGIIVSEPMSDTDTMIKSAEGPLQVTGLIVTGSIPVQAKYVIQNKLASGVRLI